MNSNATQDTPSMVARPLARSSFGRHWWPVDSQLPPGVMAATYRTIDEELWSLSPNVSFKWLNSDAATFYISVGEPPGGTAVADSFRQPAGPALAQPSNDDASFAGDLSQWVESLFNDVLGDWDSQGALAVITRPTSEARPTLRHIEFEINPIVNIKPEILTSRPMKIVGSREARFGGLPRGQRPPE